MKLGAEPKKLAVLGLLLVVLAYVAFFMPSGDDPPRGTASKAPAVRENPGAASEAPLRASQVPAALERPRLSPRAASGIAEFRPSLRPARQEERADPLNTDPTLRLDVLEKLRSITFEGGERSLFEFAQRPSLKLPEPKIVPKPVAASAPPPASPAPPPPAAAPAKPKGPPIPLKFYGFVAPGRTGQRRAFFLDGEDVLVAAEGEVIKNRYKVIRIGSRSVVLEDTQFQDQQTLPLEPEKQG